MGINDYIKIGSKIKELRMSKGLTQREMAKQLNLSFSTYSNYENNYREPKLEIIEEIAGILGVTIQYLIGTSSSDKLEEDYRKTKGTFIDYLYSLGYSVETSLERTEDSSIHYIIHDNQCYMVDSGNFNNVQHECAKYAAYLMNDLLETARKN